MQEGRRFLFQSTHKSRAAGSRDAFIRGFANAAIARLPASDAADNNHGAAAATASATATDSGADGAPTPTLRRLTHEDDVETVAALLRALSLAYDEDQDDVREAEEDAAAARGEEQIVVVAPPTCPDPDATAAVAAAAAAAAAGSTERGGNKASALAAAAAAAASLVSKEQHHYAKLRFFDTCASFLKYKKSRGWAGELAPYTANATRPGSSENSFLSQLFTRDHLAQIAEMGTAKRDKRKGKGGATWPSSFSDPYSASSGGKASKKAARASAARAASAAASVLGRSAAPASATPTNAGSSSRNGAAAVRAAAAVEAGGPGRAGPRSKGRSMTSDLVVDLYSMCQIQANAYHKVGMLCASNSAFYIFFRQLFTLSFPY